MPEIDGLVPNCRKQHHGIDRDSSTAELSAPDSVNRGSNPGPPANQSGLSAPVPARFQFPLWTRGVFQRPVRICERLVCRSVTELVELLCPAPVLHNGSTTASIVLGQKIVPPG